MKMNYLVFLGSARASSPPYPQRLGLRVAKAVINHMTDNNHNADLIDPLNYALGDIFKPHFSYKRSDLPEGLQDLADKIDDSDGYVMVSPEYNHSMSPSLAHLLNHFGSSLFSYKPSVIATYSAGQWGGARAAVNMRTYLCELGCLPVSAMIHVPKAQEVFTNKGDYRTSVDQQDWSRYLDRAISQLNWWATAAHIQRSNPDPVQRPDAFVKDPSQRNAP